VRSFVACLRRHALAFCVPSTRALASFLSYKHGCSSSLIFFIATLQNAMNQPKDAKEKAREYIERRCQERRENIRSPLHDPEQIRHEIGWDLVERRQQDRREK
jgi:hypothetical protein